MDVSFRYLETAGEGAVVRPWVWVTYLFLGPALGTIAFQWYIFIMVSGSRYNGVTLPLTYAFLPPPDRHPSARLGYRHAARF